MKKYDAVITGFGKGGKPLAGTLAANGRKVALIEKDSKMYVGTCINVGCIPSKSFVASAAFSAKLDSSFIDSRHVAVALQDETLKLEADQIFINTGAHPFIPPIEGLSDSRRAYISETMLSLEKLPKHLVIIGGGYIGMEFASIYTNFGSRVTVIQDGEVFLPREDRDIADAVAESLKERGVKLLLSTKITSVRDEEAETIVSVKTPEGDEKISADAVLIATGRRPNVDDLNLEAAGVELTPRCCHPKGKCSRTKDRSFKSRDQYEDKRDFRCSSVLRRIPQKDQPDKLAMDAHLPYTVLKDMIYIHPTMSEALNDLFNIQEILCSI